MAVKSIRGCFYYHGLAFNAWISNHKSSKVLDEITYPFLNFNSAIFEEQYNHWSLGMDK